MSLVPEHTRYGRLPRSHRALCGIRCATVRPGARSPSLLEHKVTVMTTREQPLPSPTRIETQVERVLLARVPTAKHADLLTLLRSSDRSARAMALVLIQLDREDAARHGPRRPPQRVPVAAQAEVRPLLGSPDRTVREVAQLLIQLDREDAARRGSWRRPQRRRPQSVPPEW